MTAPVAVRPMQHFDPQDSQPDLGIWVVKGPIPKWA